MDSNIYRYLLKHVSRAAESIDRLIVSSYVEYHNIKVVKNKLIKQHLIKVSNDQEELQLLGELLSLIRENTLSFGFEELIELFEFVISPSDKIINGAVYTPINIRSYIVDQTLNESVIPVEKVIGFDAACGCGGFLLTLSKAIKDKTNRSFSDIYKTQIYGADITEYSINRAELLLSLQAVSLGEDANFEFNFVAANSLNFNFKKHWPTISKNNGFDLILGNPPYVASRNMDKETLRLSLLLEVSQSGHPDLYIPFFQIGIQFLSPYGLLGYITVNTFMKSVNGRALRSYFEEKSINLKIINFGGEQLFEERNTYTCICILTQTKPAGISYFRTISANLLNIKNSNFRDYNYDELDHRSGWNLVNSALLDGFIRKIEKTGQSFESLYNTKNGIATLKNKSYKFIPIKTDYEFHYLSNDSGIYPIETGICRNIINANKLKRDNDLQRIREKIIYPYRRLPNGQLVIIDENEMKNNFPFAYAYLITQKGILAERDKGKAKDGYETWYAYGRRQSMDNYPFKLFFPHICERPNFIITEESDLLFYNGLAVISNEIAPLRLLKKILESELFYQYIKNTTKDYASGYISMSRNYLKNFGIPKLKEAEIKEILNAEDSNPILEKIYKVKNEIKNITK